MTLQPVEGPPLSAILLPMSISPSQHRLPFTFFGIILLVLIFHALFPRQVQPYTPEETTMENCIGTPINVPYSYTGNVVDPWSCKPQCDDDKPRYLLYTNAVATQCETPPGCNDWGEDRGIRCKIPGPVPTMPPGPGSQQQSKVK